MTRILTDASDELTSNPLTFGNIDNTETKNIYQNEDRMPHLVLYHVKYSSIILFTNQVSMM